MATAHQKIELNAQKREILGARVRHLRKSGFVPAVLYGKGQEAISLQIPVKDFSKTLTAAGESTLVYVNVDGQAFPTIIHDVVRDVMTDDIVHADFYKVRLDEAIKTMVPVVFEGESAAVKEKLGIFVRNVNELEVEALPQDLPHEITINISSLKNFGDQILAKDINLGPKVKLTAEPEEILATVQEPMSEEEFKASLEAPTTTVEDVEVIKKEEAPVEEEETAETATPKAEEPAEESKAE
ncbi:MAG: 50S ribosomal protein L25 [Candidatus Yanofskybacteria bacterium]|nr:50S ribosomal protein L25 [Candidatus Yanofskybacteria bacterium]